jgi:hypothetical protein
LALGASLALAQPDSPSADFILESVDAVRDLPLVRTSAPMPSTCRVAPLPAVEGAEAAAMESGSDGDDAIDTSGLVPAMARALERFRSMIASAGGSFELKSAYRPVAYQTHLQEVWFKWRELRFNHDHGCQALRAQVNDEFTRHKLLPTQKPVTDSDHTRGLAFDAAVKLPRGAQVKRHRVSLDRLALLAGIKRPDVRRDPVHFKLAGQI